MFDARRCCRVARVRSRRAGRARRPQRSASCSPGCGPTTWSGTTGSTTTCSATTRRRSTSSPGTPTRTNLPGGAAPPVPRHLQQQLARRARRRSRCSARRSTSARVTVDTYVTGATTDHLTPWKGCYRTTQLLGGDSTFILSNAGHIASLVNPPGNPKAHYFAGPEPDGDPDDWRDERARSSPGTWWEHWADWVARALRRGAQGADAAGQPQAPRRSSPRPARTCVAGALRRSVTEPELCGRPRRSAGAKPTSTRVPGVAARRARPGLRGLRATSGAGRSTELEGFWRRSGTSTASAADARRVRRSRGREMPGARWFAGARLQLRRARARPRRRPTRPGAGRASSEGDGRVDDSRASCAAASARSPPPCASWASGRGDRVAAYLPNIPEAVVAMLATTSIGAVWIGLRARLRHRRASSTASRSRADGPLRRRRLPLRRPRARPRATRSARASGARCRRVRATLLVGSLRPEPSCRRDSTARSPFDGRGRRAASPSSSPCPFDASALDPVLVGHHGPAQGHRPGHGGILLEHLKSLGLCHGPPAGRPLLLPQLDELDGVELPGRRAPARRDDRRSTTAARLPRHRRPLAGRRGARGATVLGMGSAYARACQKADVRARRARLTRCAPSSPPDRRCRAERLALARATSSGPSVRIDSICGGTDVCTRLLRRQPAAAGVRRARSRCRWLGVPAQAFDAAGRPVDRRGRGVRRHRRRCRRCRWLLERPGRRALPRRLLRAVPRASGARATGSRSPRAAACIVSGRSDATLNRGGVRIGSAEIYGVVERLPEVADSLVVGVELDDGGGYYMPLFVVPADGRRWLDDELSAAIRSSARALSPPRARRDRRRAAIPRTLTGKKLEVPVSGSSRGPPRSRSRRPAPSTTRRCWTGSPRSLVSGRRPPMPAVELGGGARRPSRSTG